MLICSAYMTVNCRFHTAVAIQHYLSKHVFTDAVVTTLSAFWSLARSECPHLAIYLVQIGVLHLPHWIVPENMKRAGLFTSLLWLNVLQFLWLLKVSTSLWENKTFLAISLKTKILSLHSHPTNPLSLS